MGTGSEALLHLACTLVLLHERPLSTPPRAATPSSLCPRLWPPQQGLLRVWARHLQRRRARQVPCLHHQHHRHTDWQHGVYRLPLGPAYAG